MAEWSETELRLIEALEGRTLTVDEDVLAVMLMGCANGVLGAVGILEPLLDENGEQVVRPSKPNNGHYALTYTDIDKRALFEAAWKTEGTSIRRLADKLGEDGLAAWVELDRDAFVAMVETAGYAVLVKQALDDLDEEKFAATVLRMLGELDGTPWSDDEELNGPAGR